VEIGGEAKVEHEAVWEMVLPMMKIRTEFTPIFKQNVHQAF
jgi:hypothetical protein